MGPPDADRPMPNVAFHAMAAITRIRGLFRNKRREVELAYLRSFRAI